VPTGTSLPTQNSYGAFTKSGLITSIRRKIFILYKEKNDNFYVKRLPSVIIVIVTTAKEYFISFGSIGWSDALTIIVCLPRFIGASFANTSPVSGLIAKSSDSLFEEYDIL